MSQPAKTTSFDLSRAVFYVLALSMLVAVSFGVGLRSGASRNRLFQIVVGTKATIQEAFKTTFAEASTVTRTHPTHFLQPSRYAGEGVTINAAGTNQSDLVLISSFYGSSNELRLIRRNGDIVARWPVSFYGIMGNADHVPTGLAPAGDWNVDTHGALALPDGSVVFNFEWGGLVKLDRCGAVQWTLHRQTHHSVERASDGGYWVPGRRTITSGPSPFPPFQTPISEDTILHVSADGKVLSETSVPGIFYANDLAPLLTATGSMFRVGMEWDHEIVHMNKIGELGADLAPAFPMFAAGDLVLSMRDQNLVMVVDRTASHVKWWKVGPWVRQHDPEFEPGGKILMFNNNTYETAYGTAESSTPAGAPRVSNILETNPATGESRVVYGGTKEQQLLSVIRGKVARTASGGLFVTEFEGGRVFETDPAGNIVWQYINRYSPQEVAEVTEARLYPASYFTVNDWSCRASGR